MLTSGNCPGCGFAYYSAGSFMNHVRGKKKDCTPEMRFWGKVEKTATCWIWKGALNSDGYGNTIMPKPSRKNMYAHRRSWEEANGPIPKGQQVLHRCDTPACVNPAHLFLGTHDDNMADKRRKGREYRHRANGRFARKESTSTGSARQERK